MNSIYNNKMFVEVTKAEWDQSKTVSAINIEGTFWYHAKEVAKYIGCEVDHVFARIDNPDLWGSIHFLESKYCISFQPNLISDMDGITKYTVFIASAGVFQALSCKTDSKNPVSPVEISTKKSIEIYQAEWDQSKTVSALNIEGTFWYPAQEVANYIGCEVDHIFLCIDDRDLWGAIPYLESKYRISFQPNLISEMDGITKDTIFVASKGVFQVLFRKTKSRQPVSLVEIGSEWDPTFIVPALVIEGELQDIDKSIWYHVKPVAKYFHFEVKYILSLVDSEHVCTVKDLSERFAVSIWTGDSLTEDAQFISESGVYQLIFRSKKPSAKVFGSKQKINKKTKARKVFNHVSEWDPTFTVPAIKIDKDYWYPAKELQYFLKYSNLKSLEDKVNDEYLENVASLEEKYNIKILKCPNITSRTKFLFDTGVNQLFFMARRRPKARECGRNSDWNKKYYASLEPSYLTN